MVLNSGNVTVLGEEELNEYLKGFFNNCKKKYNPPLKS